MEITIDKGDLEEFQFPTNGKAYPKKWMQMQEPLPCFWVSIPYERESISKEYGNVDFIDESNVEFQFPTNGKAYPKKH